MLRKLKEVASNTYLVEVEIYDGASQDVVWRSANPDFEGYSGDEARKGPGNEAEKFWNWGRTQSTGTGQREIWADELGTLKANIKDNCSNKDRYLALKVRKN